MIAKELLDAAFSLAQQNRFGGDPLGRPRPARARDGPLEPSGARSAGRSRDRSASRFESCGRGAWSARRCSTCSASGTSTAAPSSWTTARWCRAPRRRSSSGLPFARRRRRAGCSTWEPAAASSRSRFRSSGPRRDRRFRRLAGGAGAGPSERGATRRAFARLPRGE